MFKSVTKIGCCLVAGAISMNVYAGKPEGQLVVHITNQTQKLCQRTEFYKEAGEVLSEPSNSLMPYQTTRFVLEQSYFLGSPTWGPHVFISYSCGDQVDDSKIRLEVSQSKVILFGSTPQVNMPYSSRLNIETHVWDSSWFNNTPGHVFIDIFPK
jgi:hypothetical protein